MFEIAGGILIAIFVLIFFRVFLALGIFVLACVAIGVAIYFFNLEWVLDVASHVLLFGIIINPVFWIIGGVWLFAYLKLKREAKLKDNIQSNLNLLDILKNLNLEIKKQNHEFTIEKKWYFIYHHHYVINIGNFWISVFKNQFTFSKYISEPKFEILDANKKVLFGLDIVDYNGNEMFLYTAKKIEFDYELLGTEINEYLSCINTQQSKH